MDHLTTELIYCVFFPQILDKLLDRESQTHKPQTLSSFYSSKPATGSQRSPSKHTTGSHSAVGGAAGAVGVSKHGPSSSSSSAASLPAPSSSSVVVLSGEVADLKPVQNSTTGEGSAESREHGKGLSSWSREHKGPKHAFYQDTSAPHTSLSLKHFQNTPVLTPFTVASIDTCMLKNTL